MASFHVILRLSLATLWESKLRSLLTLIGMIFGNAAVVATLSSNEGAKQFIAKQLAALGNKIMEARFEGIRFEPTDVSIISKYADELDYAVLEQNLGTGKARFLSRVSDLTLMTADHKYFQAMNLEIVMGRDFLESEREAAEPVVIIGDTIRKSLFGNNTVINQYINVQVGDEIVSLKVIGSLKEKGMSAGVPADTSLFVVSEYGQKISSTSSRRVVMLLKDDTRSSFAKRQVTALLYPKYGDSAKIVDAREVIEKTKAIWGKQNLVGICLAGISLLTGGVGIMNIMLLSIHQRQKEIGLRKAVGAKNTEIAVQFLTETIIICMMGGFIGVAAGWGFGKQVASLMGNWEATLSYSSILVALFFSVLTGVIFGAAPAMRAARIDPYDALRTG